MEIQNIHLFILILQLKLINFEYCLEKSFQEILYRIDNWINKGSGWIIESINGEYVNISAYSPLIGSTYIEFPSG